MPISIEDDAPLLSSPTADPAHLPVWVFLGIGWIPPFILTAVLAAGVADAGELGASAPSPPGPGRRGDSPPVAPAGAKP